MLNFTQNITVSKIDDVVLRITSANNDEHITSNDSDQTHVKS